MKIAKIRYKQHSNFNNKNNFNLEYFNVLGKCNFIITKFFFYLVCWKTFVKNSSCKIDKLLKILSVINRSVALRWVCNANFWIMFSKIVYTSTYLRKNNSIYHLFQLIFSRVLRIVLNEPKIYIILFLSLPLVLLLHVINQMFFFP